MKRILVVDDSAVVRSIEKQILSGSKILEYAGGVKSLPELKTKLQNEIVDGIVIDAEVIMKDRLVADADSVFEEVKKFKVPVLIFFPENFKIKKAPEGIRAITKPSFTSLNEQNIAMYTSIVENLLTTSSHDMLFKTTRIVPEKTNVIPEKSLGKVKAVFIGVSTGGPVALRQLLDGLGTKFEVPVFITQHVDSLFDKKLIQWLDSSVALTVKLAEDMEEPKTGFVYFAPADVHLTVVRSVTGSIVIKLNNDPPVNFLKPSIDKMFESAASAYGNNCAGVILTGMGNDGTKGCCLLKKSGGYTITESEESCVVYGMPRAAYEAGGAVEVLPLNKIAKRLKELVVQD